MNDENPERDHNLDNADVKLFALKEFNIGDKVIHMVTRRTFVLLDVPNSTQKQPHYRLRPYVEEDVALQADFEAKFIAIEKDVS